MNFGMDYLLKRVWDVMGLVRVYTKKMGMKFDFEELVVLSDFCGGIVVKYFCV